MFSVRRTLPYHPAINPALLEEALAGAIAAAKAKSVQLTPNGIHFRCGLQFDRRNVLSPFDGGELMIDPIAYVVRLRVSFASLGTIVSAVLVVLGIVGWVKLGPSPVIPELLALGWLWIVLGNAFYGAFRLSRYLRESIRGVEQTR